MWPWRWVVSGLVALALAASATSLAGQARGCAVQLDSVGGRGAHVDYGGGRVHQYAGGGVWASCRGQDTRMYADSVAWYAEYDRVDFIGRVEFRDSAVTLNAQRASYFLREERLDAHGAVRLVNRKTGSDLQGPQLTYWREVPGRREQAELYAQQRPTVRYRSGGPAGSGRADPSRAEPYVIVARRVRMRGEGAAWAGGDVTVDRTDFSAAADSAALDLDRGLGHFVGRARVESEDWSLSSDTIQFFIVNDRIESGIAWGDSTRPVVASASYRLTADSVAFDTPNQALREIRGFGRARATAVNQSPDSAAARDSTGAVLSAATADSASSTDSVAVDPPEPDWVAGDTLVARFDTTVSGSRVLRTLEAQGKAQAFYRVYEEDGTTLAGINYSRGQRIVAVFRDDGIEKVHVIGGSDGVYLEPVRRPRPTP